MPSAEREVEGLAGAMGDSRFLAFIAHFNGDGDYYECHEVMEELWLEEGRSPLLQGLLQAAVGLHHWDNGNLSGAVKLMSAAHHKLSRYGDEALGLDLMKIRECLRNSLEILAERPKDAPFHAFKVTVTDVTLVEAVKAWEERQGLLEE